MLPIVILPHILEPFASKKYKKYGGNIGRFCSESARGFNSNISELKCLGVDDFSKQSESIDIEKQHKNTESKSQNSKDSKDILCFIGGFLDSYCRLLFDIFVSNYSYYNPILLDNLDIKNLNTKNIKGKSVKSENLAIFKNPALKHFISMYITFNCFDFLRFFMPNALSAGYRFHIIAHSWGAKNIIRLSLKHNFAIKRLLTLDCVGYINITHRPNAIGFWENIYIDDFYSHYNRANLAALIGNAKKHIAFADFNIALLPPLHHASVREMLGRSSWLRF